mmetsp:Transcript_22929/g.47884  ORF Transcript_22929/g.47884 Transcript_22929/m.47884 type:complete len:414 (-) Transcript_22929:202-1443(-)
MRRLYRWGFKQIDKRTSGSGHYVFTNEVFRRDNDMYLRMKPVPRHKNESQKVTKDKNFEEKSDSLDAHNSATDRSRSGVNSVESTDQGTTKEMNYQEETGAVDAHSSGADRSWIDVNSFEASSRSANVGANYDNTQYATSPISTVHVNAELAANEFTTMPPTQLASSQHDLVSLMNPILANHLPSSVSMSLQTDSTDILQGCVPAQLNWIQQQIIQSLNNNTSQTSQSSNQEISVLNIDGAIRSLTQGHLFVVPSGHAPNFPPPTMMHQVPGQAPSFPPPMNSIDAIQHRFMTPALFPAATQAYNPPVQQTVAQLSASNLQLLMGRQSQLWQMSVNQAQAQQHAIYHDETTLDDQTGTPATTSTPPSSNEGRSGAILDPYLDTTATATSSTSSEDWAMPPSSRKRARSPSQDK